MMKVASNERDAIGNAVMKMRVAHGRVWGKHTAFVAMVTGGVGVETGKQGNKQKLNHSFQVAEMKSRGQVSSALVWWWWSYRRIHMNVDWL